MGNVVMHDFARAGDIVYSSQAERLQSSMYNGAPCSIVELPLEGVFQIRGVQRVYRKWKYFVPDHGLAYSFTLKGKATVYVAANDSRQLDWLSEQGFAATGKTLRVGFWGWPYRYRNRPPDKIVEYEIFAKDFAAGSVTLGKNSANKRDYPYIVFVKPALLAYERFQDTAAGRAPEGWRIEANGGTAGVVDNPDYDAEIRPTVFNLSTVPRYTPLDLQSLRMQSAEQSTAAATAELPFRKPVTGDFVVQYRAKVGQTDCPTSLSVVTSEGKALLSIRFGTDGKIGVSSSKGEDVRVAPYEPGRWYNVTAKINPAQGQCHILVEDDRLNQESANGLALPDAASGPFKGILMQHDNNRPGAWIDYDALIAYER